MVEGTPLTPEVHRMTPYEFDVTAQPTQELISCTHAISVRASELSLEAVRSLQITVSSTTRPL